MQQRFVDPESQSSPTSGSTSPTVRPEGTADVDSVAQRHAPLSSEILDSIVQDPLLSESADTSASLRDERSRSSPSRTGNRQTAYSQVESAAQTEEASLESKRRGHQLALLTQPAAAWSLLIAVAATTGILSVDNPSLRQPILLHAVPQILALLAGYRLRDIRKGALAGASFHVARAVLIMLLSAWPRFQEVVAENPAQMAWLFLLPPALGAFGGWLGSVKQHVVARRGFAPVGASLAAASLLIAATTAGIAPRFLQPAPSSVLPGAAIADAPLAALPYFSETSGRLSVGSGNYDYQFQVIPTTNMLDAVARVNAPGTNAALLTPDQVIRSEDGSTTLGFNRSGELVWTKGGEERVITAARDSLSRFSISQDGNMVVFRQGEDFMVFTPSKGLRGVEDLIRQFWQDPLFEVADGSAVAAGFGRDTNALNMVFPSETGEAFTATLRMEPTAAEPAPPPTAPEPNAPTPPPTSPMPSGEPNR